MEEKERVWNEKGWRRIRYWTVLLNPLFLLLYAVGLKILAGLCKYGGVRRRLPALAVCGLAGVLWLIVWTVRWFRQERNHPVSGKRLLLACLCAELLFFAGFSGYYGKIIVNSAKPYNGKLAWKLDEMKSSKRVTLEHDNIYRDGVDGIFQDLEKLHLPENLYVSNEFTVRFDKEGNIQEIYSFLYGDGKHYLLDYNRAHGKKLTVWFSGGTEKTVGKELLPMRELCRLMEKEDFLKEQADGLMEISGAGEAKLLYKGYRSFTDSAGLIALDENGSQVTAERCRNEDMEYEGYEISLYVPNREDVRPIRFMNAWTKIELPKEEPELPEYQTGVCSREPDTENLYYMLNDTKGWKLTVADAALGSRWYRLEATSDGGVIWQTIHEDPFEGNMGVAAGIEFYNDQLGFLLLGSASDSYASLYVTRDGGLTTEKIELPTEGMDLEDYQYMTMPVRNGNVLQVHLMTEKYGETSLVFESEDEGRTWKSIDFKMLGSQ